MSLLSFNRWYRTSGARVGKWLPGTETWDTSVAIPNLQGIMIKEVFDTDHMKIFGAEEHGLAVPTALDITLKFGGIDNTSANVMTGRSSTESGSGDSEQRTTRHEGGADLGYFGLIAAIAGQGGSDLHALIPRIKCMDDFDLELDGDNKFILPDITARGYRLRLADNSLYPLMDAVEHAVATAIETDFAAAFTALS